MLAPFAKGDQKILDGFIVRPELAQQYFGIVDRPLALLCNQFIHCRAGVEVIPGVTRLIQVAPPHS